MPPSRLSSGDSAPDFSLPSTDGEIGLAQFRGKRLVLYFYPKDDTSGCTAQACAFNDSLPAFQKLDVPVIGISKDSLKKHDAFRKKYGLTFPLVSDSDSDVCERYGVWVEKSMYGRKYMGIERTTFLIGAGGIIEQVWNKVKIDGHAETVRLALT